MSVPASRVEKATAQGASSPVRAVMIRVAVAAWKLASNVTASFVSRVSRSAANVVVHSVTTV